MAPIVTVFRSRLRPDVPADYWDLADELLELARAIDGFLEHKVFVADDGERCTIVVFADATAESEWRDHVAHRAAQHRGRLDFYTEYDVAVCEQVRRHRWTADQPQPEP
jgi:heme-degrading monooxygenase HmoA